MQKIYIKKQVCAKYDFKNSLSSCKSKRKRNNSNKNLGKWQVSIEKVITKHVNAK